MRRVLAALVLVAACGSGSPKAPPLQVSQALATVDRMIAAHDYSGARAALDELVRRTVAAQRSGSLDQSRAQRITVAAAQLSADLPTASARPVVVTPAPVPPPPRHEERKHHKGHGGDGGGD